MQKPNDSRHNSLFRVVYREGKEAEIGNWFIRVLFRHRYNEMGSRYLFIVLYVWLENTLSRGDYQVREPARGPGERSAAG